MDLGYTISQDDAFLVDAHVHFHACFDPQAFFDGAIRNFRRGAAQLDLAANSPRFLLFTEAAGDDYFRRLKQGALPGAHWPWRFRGTAEECSLIASRQRGEEELILVAGWQVVTREGLEVLALGVTERLPDGMKLIETLNAARDCGAVAVLPWGFGKWWFRRGKLVASVLDSPEVRELIFVGDNGGRPNFSRRPGHFALAESRGIHVLPGSDPLPFPSQEAKAGSYGFALDGKLDAARPAESLKQALRELKHQPPVYGHRERLPGFLRYQVSMQFRKRAQSR